MTIIQLCRPFLCVIIIAILFASCKKNKGPEEELPVFGTCDRVATKGNLSYNDATKTYTFRTSGGGTITIDPIVINIKHDDYPGFFIEFWGDAGTAENPANSANHENLNSKHIKDRLNTRRTVIFPDGAKITTVAVSAQGLPVSISIYQGSEVHYINTGCNNTLEYSVTNSTVAQKLDDAEPDGETSTFEFTPTGLLYLNIYTENEAGNKIMERVPLGQIYRDNPLRVDDLFDDPRLAHT